jgi:hypothetical protein
MSAAATAGRIRPSGERLLARCESHSGGRDCRILALDHQGAFIESFVPFKTGVEVKLRFQLPNGHEISAAGVVGYHQFKVGFGVEFSGLSHSDLEQLRSFSTRH